MQPRSSASIFSLMSSSPQTELVDSMDVGFGRRAAIWRNTDDRIRYERPDGHTLSLYLKGGTGTRRIDSVSGHGWPGALCIFPQDASSEWEITDTFELLHLYVPDGELRRAFSETFDRDARMMELPEATFDDAPALAASLGRLAEALRSRRPLLAEEIVTEALALALSEPSRGGRLPSVKGGLAPVVRRRLADHIEANIDGTITLDDLSVIAGLSPFHLQRMFTASCGVSPHAWVHHRRLARAKAMLHGTETIAGIATACGFSSQAHMTNAFRTATGMTPAAYRKALA